MGYFRDFAQDLPIRRKVSLVILLTCGTALAVAAAAIFAFHLATFRRNFTRDMQATAEIIGNNSTAALTFNQAKEAAEILSALKAKPSIVHASIKLPGGEPFATLPDQKLRLPPPAPNSDGFQFVGRYLFLHQPILLAGERIGTLHLVSDYRTESSRSLLLYGAILALVSMVSVLLALVLSSRLQGLVSDPILRLADTAQSVAEMNDYSVRAEKMGRDEVGRLTEAFNQMLAKIQSHSAALQQANLALGQEIAEHKRTAADLAFERDLLTMLLDNLPDAIYFKDRDSRFVRFSAAMAQLFNVADADGLKGRSDFDFFTEEHARPAFNDEQEIIRTGQPIIAKLERETHADGRLTWALTTKVPWRDRQGNIIGTFGVSKDITSIKHAEEEVEKLNRELLVASRQAGMAEVATGVLHNVGNVLNSANVSITLIRDHMRRSHISSLVKLAELLQQHAENLGAFLTTHQKGKLVPEFVIHLAQRLQEEHSVLNREYDQLARNIEHIKEIVAMQQTYARVSDVREKTIVAELVDEALQIQSADLEHHAVQVVRDYSEVPPLTLDKHKVLQILVNLIQNARHALNESQNPQRRLAVGIQMADGAFVRISIADNGVGILPDNLTQIFSHGFTTRKAGHGFGLHSGANAAKEMGGLLTAHSEGPGQGATFTLDLPVREEKLKA
jgi:PAS domain S-box-containing protein